MKTLIKNCRIVTPFEIVEDNCIEIEGAVISGLLSQTEVDIKNYDQVLDCKGDFVAPGFIDIHNHGNSGFDVMDATPEALEHISRFHLKNGVTGFLGTTMSQSPRRIQAAVANIVSFIEHRQETGNLRSKLLGIYLEGPYLSKKRKGAQAEEYLKDPDLAELKSFLKTAKEHLKIVALAPELTGALEMIKYIKSKGIVAAAGHTDGSYDRIVEAVEAGVTDTVHLFNGMKEFHHREPGPAGALLQDHRVTCELVCDGIHLHQAVVDIVVRLKGPGGIVLISDAMRATGLRDGQYELGGQEVLVTDGIARLRDGTLAGSTLTLDRAVYNVMKMAKIPLNEAVRMATYNPAKLIGVSQRKGSVEPGKDADLVVFDENIRIKNVLVDGKILFFTYHK